MPFSHTTWVRRLSTHRRVRVSQFSSKALSFHAVSFGPDADSQSLRRMAEIAREVQATFPVDPGSTVVESSYAEALHTVSLRIPLP